ncbi:MAG: hypothetical protein QHH10_01745 [Peptococcaceae bacterium]|jgi:TolA-binding protein|nr:hypothetical protein [Peptococcaceae bacterium]MDH7524019.1 hypothetical protein [Peptococcaceae bacterium]
MINNQIQQVQQKINSVQQMVAQVRQSEQYNQQRLQQLAQDEAYAAQQLQRVQQVCQDVVANLQNIGIAQPAGGTFQAQGYAAPNITQYGSTQPGIFTTGTTVSPVTQGFQGNQLFNPETMGAETYQGTLQTFGNVPGFQTSGLTGGGVTGAGYGYQGAQQAGYQAGTAGQTLLPTSSNLAGNAGGGVSPSLREIGQQAGISTGVTGTSQ